MRRNKIPLEGVLIGNPYVDPLTQRIAIRKLILAAGSVQFDSIPELDITEKRCYEAVGANDKEAASKYF
jgi:hypothetical protein